MVRCHINNSNGLSVSPLYTYTCPSTINDHTQAHYGKALSQLVLANIMATADFDGDGHVSPEEFVRICLQNEALFEDGPCLCVYLVAVGSSIKGLPKPRRLAIPSFAHA